jgi:hypothetical protein
MDAGGSFSRKRPFRPSPVNAAPSALEALNSSGVLALCPIRDGNSPVDAGSKIARRFGCPVGCSRARRDTSAGISPAEPHQQGT